MQDGVAQEAHSFHTIQKSLPMRFGHLKVVYLEAFLYIKGNVLWVRVTKLEQLGFLEVSGE